MEGLTGFMKFDSQGLRTFFHLYITELSVDGMTVVGTWNPNDGANFTRAPTEAPMMLGESLTNKTLIVTSKLVRGSIIQARVSQKKTIEHLHARVLFRFSHTRNSRKLGLIKEHLGVPIK